jgi:hypothetical protein
MIENISITIKQACTLNIKVQNLNHQQEDRTPN